jgi:sugar transferase EpsL
MAILPSGVPLSKRLFDIFFSAISIVILSPFLFLIWALVLLAQGPPVLFKQKRPGLHGKPFYIYKFRTMNTTYDYKGDLLPDSDRLTSLGRFMRSMSLDELPELINILKGEMSLVGPRPLLMQYLDRYSPEQARRHEVLPGITGWAQINGRNALNWEDKFRMDVWYVDNWSFFLDLRILYETIWKVFKREGISQPGHPTAEEFRGSEGARKP